MVPASADLGGVVLINITFINPKRPLVDERSCRRSVPSMAVLKTSTRKGPLVVISKRRDKLPYKEVFPRDSCEMS